MKININEKDWCEMVFQGKNKNYGAYKIRSEMAGEEFKALIIAVSLAFSIALLPVILKTHQKIIVDPIKPGSNILIDLTDPVKPEEEYVLPTPIPRPMIQFTTPIVVPTTLPEDEMPTQDLLQNSNAVIGNQNIAGDADSQILPENYVPIDDSPTKIYDWVDKPPQFPELNEYLNNNLHYPPLAAELEISGRVIVSFVVNETGEITDVTVLRGIGGGCDEEALRVVKKMPKWHPGIKKDKYVKVRYTLPIFFKLQR